MLKSKMGLESITCLNRFSGKCKKCTRDYDSSHHPNNKDCMYYQEIIVRTLIVLPKEKTQEYNNRVGGEQFHELLCRH